MGQQSLILVLLASLTVGVVLYTTGRTNDGGTQVTAVAQADDFGREAAQVGLERMVRRLVSTPLVWADTAAFTIPETTYGPATYRTRIVDYLHAHGPAKPAPAIESTMVLDDTVTVESVGTFVDGRTGDPREYVLRATYIKGVTDVGIGYPSRMAFATDKTLTMNGNNEVRQGTSDYPANVHANGMLDVFGSSRVEGTGSYSDQLSGGSPSSHFFPPTQEDGSMPPLTQSVDPVPFIPTDFSDLTRFSGAEAYTVASGGGGGNGKGKGKGGGNGNGEGQGGGRGFQISGNSVENLESSGWQQNLGGATVTGAGTPDNPFQWFINGDLGLQGNSGLQFYRDGTNAYGKRNQAHIEIYVNGDLTLGGGGNTGMITPTYEQVPSATTSATIVQNWIAENLPEGVSLWIYVNGNVTFNGNVGLVGRIKANGSVDFKGGGNKTNVIGGVEAIGDITPKGGIMVYSTLPASTGTEPSLNYNVPQGVHLIAYTEWMEGATPVIAEAP